MNEGIKQSILRLIKVANVILVSVPFVIVWYIYYSNYIYAPFHKYEHFTVIALFVLFYITFARIYDAFLVSYQRISEMIFSQILAVSISDFIMALIVALLSKEAIKISSGIAMMLGQFLIITMWSVLAHWWYFWAYKPKTSAIIYDKESNIAELIFEYGLDKKFNVEKTYLVDECKENLSILDGLETVFLSDLHSHDRNILLKYCVEKNIIVFVIPRIGDVIMSGAARMHMFHLPMLRVGRYSPLPEYRLMKRCFDIIVAGSALIVFAPIMLIVAVLIKAYDHGPVFYKQKRLTINGKEFNVLKFRSMKVNAESDGVAVLSSGENDSRITPIGRVIRKHRIDELPQLLNILEGSMSIVGPRPERPEIAAQYEEIFPEFHLRLQAKAGLTGYAQVYGKYNTTPYNKLKMDLMYIAHPSILEDLRICFATVKILFSAESTEGVQKVNHIDMEEEKNY